jgi:hypothetical protein
MSEYVCKVEVKRIYGNILYYPLNEAATKFTILLNCKTLTKLQLRRIRNCGFTIDVIYKVDDTTTDVPANLGIDFD